MNEVVKWISGNIPQGNSLGTAIDLNIVGPAVARKTIVFIKSFPQYAATPLRSLHNLAESLGVAGIYVKDESYRFGLNSFKVLGGGHAIGRYLHKQLGKEHDSFSYEELKSPATRTMLGEITFTSATDGNHGRGVAWAARQLGHRAVINMPKGSSPIRLAHITATGAEGYITDVNYDETVRLTAEKARQEGWVVIQDTAWEGYEEIPTWVMQGYTVMTDEALEQLRQIGVERPTHIFIQAGVGTLAAAVLGFFASNFRDQKPCSIVVEPNEADCFYRSALAGDGRPRVVTGDMDTIMAGLACGEPNPIAWNILKGISDMYISCPDYVAATGMRILGNPLAGDPGIVSGESGAVTTGILVELLRNDALKEAREALRLKPDSKILLFSTEGDTDPVMYRKIIWDGAYPTP
jgi:diaminopropionate ammonia-lyase